MFNFIFILEIIGVLAFSITGALDAIESKTDLLGVLILGVTTAVGGGLIRDIVLGINPPKSFVSPIYVYIALAASLATFLFLYLNRNVLGNNVSKFFDTMLTTTDAIGLSVFTILGMNVAYELNYDYRGLVYIFVGLITGVGGGILRDVLSRKIPYVLERNIYASASIIGALLYYYFRSHTDIGVYLAMIISMLVIFSIRMYAASKDLSLPKIKN